jgi:hypothetical protein
MATVEKMVKTLGCGPINRWFGGGGLGPSGWVWLGPLGLEVPFRSNRSHMLGPY